MSGPSPLFAWKIVGVVLLALGLVRWARSPRDWTETGADPMVGLRTSLAALGADGERPRLVLLGNSLFTYTFDDLAAVQALVDERAAHQGLPSYEVLLLAVPRLCFVRMESQTPLLEAARMSALVVQLDLLVPTGVDPCPAPRWTDHLPQPSRGERTAVDELHLRQAWRGGQDRGPSLEIGRGLLERLASRGVAVRLMEIPLSPTGLATAGEDRQARRRALAAPWPLITFPGATEDTWYLDFSHPNGAGRAAMLTPLIEALLASLAEER